MSIREPPALSVRILVEITLGNERGTALICGVVAVGAGGQCHSG